ncbi:MAG: methylmalonyl-CoA mutase family protein [Acidobacteria bacterium]|nr:methylmalonyl-CoA mutase family protein [Acidobacteriota bacterium]
MKKGPAEPIPSPKASKAESKKTRRPAETSPDAPRPFTTISGFPVNELYTPDDLAGFDERRDLGEPGQFPFVRGIHPNMYRGKLWTMRQFSGFATPEETNQRYRYLLSQGQTGLSVAFDLPTLMGYDADDPLAEGEVGKCGVAVSSLEDMEILFAQIPLEKITTSMTINSPAAILWAMYLVVAEKQGADWKKISGTIQNDILKEYIAQKEFIFPPGPSMRLVVDTIEFSARHTPRFNPISISGYHIREAGSTAAQELAFTLRDGIEYAQAAIERGLKVDEFAPRLSFFFNAHNDFFEEIAKYRAARKVWAHVMQDRFGAKDPRSWACRFHAQTAGCSLTAQQPYNNVVRTTIQALAAVLGGTQSLHTNSLDEALALPTEEAATLALRTQQVLAEESGVASTADPLAGSYFLERLTLDMEQACYEYFRQIDEMGGMIAAIERGFPQKEIAQAAYQYQRAIESREKIIIGVNAFAADQSLPQPLLKTLSIDFTTNERQAEKLRRLRTRRDSARADAALDALEELARANPSQSEPRASASGQSTLSSANLMPSILDCVRAYLTVGEICHRLRAVFGVYKEPSVI